MLQSRWTNLKKELMTTVIPMFLSNHPNSVPVLHAAWHCAAQSQNVRGLVLHAMAEWYMRGEPHDQARLSRILDVAQDLKVCSTVFSTTDFQICSYTKIIHVDVIYLFIMCKILLVVDI